MYVDKKIQIEFTEDEKEIINNFIALKSKCEDNGLCDYMVDCSYCPFDSLCTNNISNANEVEDHVNENLE